ncbi:hypothetical protein [Rufibacter ruber]|uniref:hypothetical protein n=1 Tax=Rufibacter ruber TaxID=1783499 RepID=UPI000835674A
MNWKLSLNASHATYKLQGLPGLVYGSRTFFIDESYPKMLNGNGALLYSYYLQQQKYQNGKPVEGQYEDRDGDSFPDQVPAQSAVPTTLLGLNSRLTYQKWSFNFLARAELGHSVYNGFAAFYGNYRPNSIVNMSTSVLTTNFRQSQYLSDYYLEDASFLRLEYLSLGYDFGRVFKNRASLQLEATAQNVFVLTDYSGQDPETAYGFDGFAYPKARTFSLQLNVTL